MFRQFLIPFCEMSGRNFTMDVNVHLDLRKVLGI